VTGPRPGTPFKEWTLRTPDGSNRTSEEMPAEYTLLFAAESCGPCHALFAKIAKTGRTVGTLVVAADGPAPSLREAAMTDGGPLYDQFLTGADKSFRDRFNVPGTPFALAIRQQRIVASGPARTPEDVQKLANELRSTNRAAPTLVEGGTH